jgi:hypothetical protein
MFRYYSFIPKDDIIFTKNETDIWTKFIFLLIKNNIFN